EAGNHYVLVAMDYFTKWTEAYVLPDQSVPAIVDALLEGMFARLGLVFARVCQCLDISETRTTPLHPQSDRLVERFYRTLPTQLATQWDWDLHLPLALWVYRITVQESTGCTPALLMLCREMRTLEDLVFGLLPGDESAPPVGSDYEWDLRQWMRQVHSFARTHLTLAGVQQKWHYDLCCRGPAFQPGDLVWVYSPCHRKGISPKLAPSWEGTAEVLGVVGEVCYGVWLRTRGRVVVLHQDRLAPYRVWKEEPRGEAPESESADNGASADCCAAATHAEFCSL
uniref:Integrase catalytic domain-containing protein n=1 Tax=Lepisosteus oculatus TaxID=7918 RepID=W5LW72_LEPOC